MAGYISYPISASPNDILLNAYNYIKSQSPLWVENDGNLDTWILQAMASEASDLRELAQDVPDTIFQWFGQTILGFPAIDAVPASANSTWVATDSAGHTIPAGTQVGIKDSLGNIIAFNTVDDVIIPAGTTSTAAGAVALEAALPGAAGTNLGGAGIQATLLDTYAWVSSITLTGATSGGLDAETSSDYNDRLSMHLMLLSTRPIIASDFALKTMEVAGVYRAVAIDGYNPASGGSYGNQRMVAVAALDSNGNNVSSTVKTQISNLLQANREINFIVNVIDPTRSSVDISFTAKAFTGYDPNVAASNVVTALQSYLNPQTWGVNPAIGDSSNVQTWIDLNVVRYSEIAQIISNADGINYWTAITLGLHGGALSAADVTVPGPASIVTAGTITPTVS